MIDRRHRSLLRRTSGDAGRQGAVMGSVRRVALVGLGAAARHIPLPAYRSLAGARVVAGCDGAAPAERFDFPVYRSLSELLARETVDIAVIATPTVSHHALARQCLEHKLHVLCEKPFADTV